VEPNGNYLLVRDLDKQIKLEARSIDAQHVKIYLGIFPDTTDSVLERLLYRKFPCRDDRLVQTCCSSAVITSYQAFRKRAALLSDRW
jgi:hypothetical protein